MVETFGQALRRLRGSMSIRELARQAHCGKSHVSDLERGRRALYRTQAVLYLAAAKLATRTGDHDLAWIAADRGQQAALAADAPVLVATLRRQIACVFHDTGRLADADQVITTALDALRRDGVQDEPDLISARGSLHLLGAMISTRCGGLAQARQQFAAAADQAHALGRDDNRLWTAFGPTNVAIHTLAAVTLDDPMQAIHVAERIDTRLLPAPLIGRRVRVQIDLARAHASLGEDATATVHILDVAHRAPQMLRYDTAARTVCSTLLGRAQGSTVSVLRAAAKQAGIAA
ncbi:helix-turn-helix domain-containing protein [Frankia sp. CNm7]|uniref:Helix-turn-helix domain-containing protein n=1 Tax=Frankia nepalensis TaxID=1836974 RepID=A0A937RVD9_9ACTN|nr:helix-turn-helix transcriptional regulator [Frankia nepalensis]MBL7499790.1 helix-turn-helix domain-containing protein [Frankia nepalensis]MBL7512275.1 helix-turn-helix domain-containing protein [Frankia nepalensis]MBL7520440.1 helix-turn-helix domain-containing protein [Frankia nepalensis]MBL7632576.1 helix-turn-helix domain-containing protein [Frankia nepalensis]